MLGPPSVEFAPYGRVPNSRPRKDARQGTIDQDPEFIDFLESLTNPVAKSGLGDQENDGTGKSKEKVTVTPLVQFLKDKKANKGKENAAPSKGGKHGRQDSKDVKALNDSDIKTAAGTATIASPKKRSAQAVKVEQAARDAVKVLNKQAANASKGVASSQTPAVPPTAKSPVVIANNTANTALGDKKRERGNASAAAKILQRDLGLGTNAGGRGGRRGPIGHVARTAATNASIANKQDAVAPQVSSPLATASAPESTTPATATSASESRTATKPPVQPPSGPAASRQIAKAPTAFNNNASSHTTTTKPTSPPSTATQAFLKHANPSQGITEPLLEEAFATFGNINKVEIDKKKGFAYVDFAEPESLQKAIKASPIKVAQGQVVVLERKTGSSLQARNLRGGGAMMGKRGGGMPMGGRGPMRGRGGFGRGGMKMPNVNSRSATGTGTTPQTVAVAPQTPTASPSTGEGSTAPDHPAAVTSASTAPAD